MLRAKHKKENEMVFFDLLTKHLKPTVYWRQDQEQKKKNIKIVKENKIP